MAIEKVEAEELGVSDADMFNEVTTAEPEVATPEVPTEQPPAPVEQEATDDRPRDEQGRFVKVEPEATAEEKPAETVEQPAQDTRPSEPIPRWRLMEETEEKRRVAAELAETRRQNEELQRQLVNRQPPPAEQKPEELPDPILDPEGFKNALTERFEHKLMLERLDTSFGYAHEKHGETFDKAFAALEQARDPALAKSIAQARNPGEQLVKWFKEKEAMQLVGTDPEAWFKAQLAERLKDPAFIAEFQKSSQASPQQPAVPAQPNLPPSLSGVVNADKPHLGDPDESNMSDKAIYDFVLR